MVEPRPPRLLADRHPYLTRELRRQLVELQRGQQAEHTARDALRDLRERVAGGVRMIADNVDPAGAAFDQTLLRQPVKPHARDAAGFEFSRTRKAHFLDD